MTIVVASCSGVLCAQEGDLARKRAGKMKAGEETEKTKLYNVALKKYNTVIEQDPRMILAHYGWCNASPPPVARASAVKRG